LNNPAPDAQRWNGIQRGKSRHPFEWVVEKLIFLVSLTAILMVFLIFAFVTREALPIVFGDMNSAATQPVLPVADLDKTPPEVLRKYLELTPEEFASMDHDTKQLLMQAKVDAAKDASPDQDATVNTTEWRYLFLPHQWTGYDRPSYIWQPVSTIKKYNIVPLIVGSIKATVVALLFAVPLALAAAIYVSQLARPKFKEVIKPAIEYCRGCRRSWSVFLP